LLLATAAGREAITAEMAPRDRWLARAMATLLDPDEQELLGRAAALMVRLADFESDVAAVET
jgi:hypothetical protein